MLSIPGRIYKDPKSKFWVAECDSLSIFTQGKDKNDALDMVRDAIECLIEDMRSFEFSVEWGNFDAGEFSIRTHDCAHAYAFLLRRLRLGHGMSVADLAESLGYSSKNSVAAYETGKKEPSFKKVIEVLTAFECDLEIRIKPKSKTKRRAS